MNAFTGSEKTEMSIPADINPKITLIPSKNNIIDIVQLVKFPLKCFCQLDGAMVKTDLVQRSP